ncbi:MAG: aldo/keto reductase [Planctomycetes bacterium]|nr:aldo/keto reductase [Planctomycetota bacterium]
MRYSELGNTGLKVSALGFGCMRLPMKDGRVDRGLAIPMLHRAVELGVNFFDTAIGYCNSDSQAAIGEAMQAMRPKVVLSTKNSLSTASDDDWWRALENSLRLMRTDYLDLYSHHGINWEMYVNNLDPAKNGKTRLMLKARQQGLSRHIGFSFHDTPENLIKLVDTGCYENVILQYNLLDQGNADAMKYARQKGMGVVVMGPVGGGRLGLPSEQIRELTGGQAKSTPEAALRFVWGHPAVNVALSGMSEMRQLEENASLANSAKPFTPEQIATLDDAIAERKKKSGLYCTACRYCLPACQQGINIPDNLDMFNQVLIYGLKDNAKNRYKNTPGTRAAECVNCGKCMPLCPQGIKIPDRLNETALMLDGRAGSVICNTAMNRIGMDGGFQMSLRLRNFSAEERQIKVTVAGDGQTAVADDSKDFGAVPSMAWRAMTIGGKADVRRHQIVMKIGISCGPATQTLEKVYNYLVLPKGNGAQEKGDGWLSVEASEDDFTAAKDTARKHGLRFRLSRAKDGLDLTADVRDDFLFPSRAESHSGSLVDGLEVYLDGRQPSRIGFPKYEKGVYQLFLYPGTPGKYPAFFNSPQNIEGIDVSSERTPDGYRIRAKIPYASFCVAEGVPSKLGFDIAVNTADKGGKRVGQFIFAGGRDNWRDPSGFGEVWFV